MVDTVLAQLAALKAAPVGELKQKWRDLFEREPPPYNRRFLENRLAYRIQELAYGGLTPETLERLDALADELDGKAATRRPSLQNRPIAGTRLIRAPSMEVGGGGPKAFLAAENGGSASTF